MTNRITRLAPSPTGTLHLGNARTFLMNWAIARQNGWTIIMRIEDLDRTRVRPGSADAVLKTLEWLGIDFDVGPFFQFDDLEPYRQAMRLLVQRRLAYACTLTRKQIAQAASAPHVEDGEVRFPPQLRPALANDAEFNREDLNYRFIVDDETVSVEDHFAGSHQFRPHEEIGDFVIWTKLGVPSYQLAVVVDDARQGITDVFRGDDLLASAARQELLYRALNRPAPRWWHVPLVLGPDGRRLAKRHAESHLDTYRFAGVRPQRIIGLLARWCGLTPKRGEMSAAEFCQQFRIEQLPHQTVAFSQEDHQWLLEG